MSFAASRRMNYSGCATMAWFDTTMHWQCNNISLSALGGGEGRDEVGEPPAPKLGTSHLTLPAASRRSPPLSPLKGGEGLRRR
jgi:hypothetical protein